MLALTTLFQTDKDPSIRDYAAKFVLRDHSFPVGCLAWSLDDSILLTGADNEIRMWNTKVLLSLVVAFFL
jgi:WD repeat-containing protein 26